MKPEAVVEMLFSRTDHGARPVAPPSGPVPLSTIGQQVRQPGFACIRSTSIPVLMAMMNASPTRAPR